MRLGIRAGMGGLLTALVMLGPSGWAWAQPDLSAGMKDLGFGGAFSISHKTNERVDTVLGYEVLAHIGYVVTDAHGPDWLRGNVEVLLEPAVIHLDSDDGSATVAGVSVLGRWVFSGVGRYRPYLEAGAGVLFGEVKLRQTNCSVNYLLQVGPGVMIFLSDTTSVTVGYRFQHISNGGACDENIGINSSSVHIGVSYFFQ
jgi:opacity protein-like surface antigen